MTRATRSRPKERADLGFMQREIRKAQVSKDIDELLTCRCTCPSFDRSLMGGRRFAMCRGMCSATGEFASLIRLTPALPKGVSSGLSGSASSNTAANSESAMLSVLSTSSLLLRALASALDKMVSGNNGEKSCVKVSRRIVRSRPGAAVECCWKRDRSACRCCSVSLSRLLISGS